MLSRFWIGFLVSLASASTVAWFVALMREKGMRPVRKVEAALKEQPVMGRVFLVVFALVLWVVASIKPPAGGNRGGFPVVDGWEGFTPITSTNTTRTLEADDFRRGFVMARAGTGEAYDFDAPEGATTCEDWLAFGAAEDWFYVAFTNWAFLVGTNEASSFRVHSDGWAAAGTAARSASAPYQADGGWADSQVMPLFRPFKAALGIMPAANWHLLDNPRSSISNLQSRLWHLVTQSNTLQMTWQNVLLDRDTSTPVSVQMEVWPSGRFTYRYDLSRLDVEEVTNVLVGATFGGLEWTTNSIPTNLTSLAFHPLSAEDATDQDRDRDGLPLLDELFFHGTDPELADTSGDGMSDGEAVAAGLDPRLRHVPDADILARVAASATNEAFSAVVAATNLCVSWRLFDGFAAERPAGAANVVWERTFAVNRTSAWQQFFVSASPTNAAAWSLFGMALEWETDTGTSGAAVASPCGDSWRIPLSTNDFPASLTLRLRAAGEFVRSPSPLHLVAHVPEFRVFGGQEITGRSGAKFRVFTKGSDSEIGLAIDNSRRPHRASPGADECDMAVFVWFSMSNYGFNFEGDMSGGRITAWRPGICELPDISLGTPDAGPSLRSGRDGRRGATIVVLDPSAEWSCRLHGCGLDGLGYDWEHDRYREEECYPLDSRCLRRSWQTAPDSGVTYDGCELEVTGGAGDDGTLVTTSTDGERASVSVDGVQVWSKKPRHVHDYDACGNDYREDFLGDGCDACDTDCANGNCDSLEGPALGSLKFRIPLGAFAKGYVAGFAWFSSDGPIAVSKSMFRLTAHPSANVTDTTYGGTRRIASHESRGRDLRMEDIADGVRVTIYDTAAQTLEHTWEITNVSGDPARVRFRKISRLNNVMSDETFTCDYVDWTRFDNVAGVGTQLSPIDDFAEYGDGTKSETRTVTDGSGSTLESVTTEQSRIGECDNAVIRETYREEWTGTGWKMSWADYWNDPQNRSRHGKPRLVQGNARAWTYTDFDEEGRETLRVEQRGDTEVPSAFPSVISNELYEASLIENAFVTVSGYEPLDGDSDHDDDSARPRTETRYVATNGVLTPIGRTLSRYTRLTRDGYPAVKKETWRTGVPPIDAYSYEITYAYTGGTTPFLMRGAVAESLDENGILTVNAYSLADNALTCVTRRYGPFPVPHSPFPTYETTVQDATYGTTLRRTTRLTANDAIIADEQSVCDDQNRLRSTTFLDGTSLTNAYSCCRLLWTRDRQNRKTLRSAQTGTDHLYNAYEEVWITNVTAATNHEPLTTNHAFRITKHFYDALGRETNTVACIGTTPGEAVAPCGNGGSPVQNGLAARSTTTYPYGGSAYSIRTDQRGATTTTSVYHYSDCTVQDVYTVTNDTWVLCATTRSYHGGGTSVRREWPGLLPHNPDWTEERRFTEYAPNGYRIDYVVTTSSDHYNEDPYGAREYVAVTNSISTYDLLGRLVAVATPTGTTGVPPVAGWSVTSNAYDGATSRIVTTTKTGSLPVNYFYDELGERIGTAQGNKSVWNRTTYETISQQVYRVVMTVRMTGSTTNAVRIQKTQLTGLSDSCRRHTITLTGKAAILAATGTTGVSPVENGATTDSLTTYDPSTGIETTTTRTDGQTPVMTRSLHGVPLELTSLDERRTMAYDAFGQNVFTLSENSTTGATNRTEYIEYDVSGNAVRQTVDYGADGVAVSTAEFDMLNREVRRTDALGHVTETAYDGLGRPVFTGGDTYPLKVGYDTQGRKTSSSTTRDNGATWDETQWEFDPASGVNTAKVYADGSRISYDYTDNGQRTRTTWARGAWKQHAYNDRNLVSGTTYSGTATPSVAYTYDDSDKMASATLSDGTSYVYAYNDSLLCTNEAVTIAEDDFTITRTYDGFLRNEETSVMVTNVRHAAKTRFYDSENRICGYALTNSFGRGVNVAIVYDGSYLTNMVYALPNGSRFAVNLTRKPSRKELVTHRDYSYGAQSAYWYSTDYDLIGRPTNAMDSVSLMREWLYNNRSELISATIGINQYGYEYDTIGNRLWSADNIITNSYSANNLNQYTTVGRAAPSAPQVSILHDADGNMTRDGTYAYSYDAENRLRSVTSKTMTNGALRVLNAYDHRSRRIRKTVQRLSISVAQPPALPVEIREWQTLETHTFVWDGNNIVIEKVEFANGTTRTFEYFWGLDKSGTEQGAGGVGGLIAVSMDGVFSIPCYDHNGNIVLYVSETGSVAAQHTYDPYGNIIESSGPLADVFSFGFSTKYHDREIGMIGYKRRFYRPDLGRWLNRDPIEEEGGMNVYGFCGNDPIGQIDLLGMEVRSALAPTKCSEKDIDAEARKILVTAVALTQQGRPQLEHYGNLCCACKGGKYEVSVTGPIPGKIIVSYSRYGGHLSKQETPASFPDDPKIQCPKGSQRVGYYHTHISGRSFSENDLDVLEARDHRYYVSQDGKRIEKAIPQRAYNSIPNVIVPGGLPVRPVVVILK